MNTTKNSNKNSPFRATNKFEFTDKQVEDISSS